MNRYTGIILLTLLVSLQFSCKLQQASRDEQYNYHFSENGCDTGSQSFKQRDAYCNALLDDQRNHSCAKISRLELYSTQCGRQPAG